MTDVSNTVLERVSEEYGTDVTELPPLQRSVDVDALNAIAEDVPHLEFEYADVTVVIRHGDVTIHE